MRQQVMNGDLVAHILVRIVGQIFADLVIKRQLARFGKLGDGDKNKPVVPVVVIYRKKRKRGRGPGGSSLLNPFNPFGMFR